MKNRNYQRMIKKALTLKNGPETLNKHKNFTLVDLLGRSKHKCSSTATECFSNS